IRDYKVTGVQTCALPISEIDVFARSFLAHGFVWLRRIAQRRGARVPSHMPGGHVPEEDRMWLQRRSLTEEKQHARPLRFLPRRRSEERRVGKECRSRWVA